MADATADLRAGEVRIWTETAGFLTQPRVAKDGSDGRESVRERVFALETTETGNIDGAIPGSSAPRLADTFAEQIDKASIPTSSQSIGSKANR